MHTGGELSEFQGFLSLCFCKTLTEPGVFRISSKNGKGCNGAPGSEGSVLEHHKDGTGFISSRKGLEQAQGPCSFHTCCCPPCCPSLPPGAGQSSGTAPAHLHIENPKRVFQTLCDANLISLFAISFQVSHNKSQPMLGKTLPPVCLLVPRSSGVTLCCKQICHSLGLLIISVHD